jgi:hypothetical protein
MLYYNIFKLTDPLKRSRDILVDILKGYGMDDRSSIPHRGLKFSLIHSVHTGTGTHPVSYGMGIGGSFPWGKTVKAETNHLPSPSDEVRNDETIPPLPPYFFAELC